MAGTRLITPSVVGNLALMLLSNKLIATQTFSRTHQAEFSGAKKIGDRVKVRRRQAGTVIRTGPYATGTNTFQQPPETSIDVTLQYNHRIPIEIEAGDFDLDLDDFKSQVLEPQMVAIAEDVDSSALLVFKEIPQIGGISRLAPSTLPNSAADLAEIEQDLFDQKVPMQGLIHAITGTAYTGLVSSGTISSAEQRGDSGSSLENARVGRVMNLDHVRTQGIDSATFTSGTSGNVTVDGALAAGATTIIYDAATGATTTLKKYDILTIPGYGNVVVAADATASSSAGSFTIFEPLRSAVADNVVLTKYDAAGGAWALHGAAYHPDAFSFVTVPGDAPLGGVESVVVQHENLGVRIIWGYNMGSNKNQMTIDLYSGCTLVDGRLAVQTIVNV